MVLMTLLIAAICICPVQTETAIVASELLSSAQDDGEYPLSHHFRGRFTRQFSDLVDVRLPFADAEFEFTHVQYVTRSGDGKNEKQRIWVNGQRIGAGITSQSSSTSLEVRKSIPQFEVLKGLKSIHDFERELGPLGNSLGAWGSNDEIYSSKHWRGCMVDDDGNIRGVQIFLHTVNRGEGWEIEHRHVHEGIFRPATNSKIGG